MIKRFYSTQIPRAVREQLWLKTFGEKFKGKCQIKWCKNQVNIFDFTAGHNIPKSKGGSNKLSNLVVELPPNGQGATALLMLRLLEKFNLSSMDPGGAERVHLEVYIKLKM